MIRDHKSFGENETIGTHRVAPVNIVNVLEIESETPYTPIYKTDIEWLNIGSIKECLFENERDMCMNALRKYSFDHELIMIKDKGTYTFEVFLSYGSAEFYLSDYASALKIAYSNRWEFRQYREQVYKIRNRCVKKNKFYKDMQAGIYTDEKIAELVSKDEAMYKNYHSNKNSSERSKIFDNNDFYVYLFVTHNEINTDKKFKLKLFGVDMHLTESFTKNCYIFTKCYHNYVDL